MMSAAEPGDEAVAGCCAVVHQVAEVRAFFGVLAAAHRAEVVDVCQCAVKLYSLASRLEKRGRLC